MTVAESRDTRYRALADPVRRRLLRLLEDEPEPCDVETLAEAVGLHANTVRGHLDLLEEAELVARGTRPRTGPGRPRVVYQPSSDATDPESSAYRLLAELLASAVCDATGDPAGAMERVGHGWGRDRALSMANEYRSLTAGRGLVSLLEELGFEPDTHTRNGKMVIDLTDCPFRDLVERHPDVVCSLHLGLMRGAAEVWGDTEIEELQPLVAPSLCRATVRPCP